MINKKSKLLAIPCYILCNVHKSEVLLVWSVLRGFLLDAARRLCVRMLCIQLGGCVLWLQQDLVLPCHYEEYLDEWCLEYRCPFKKAAKGTYTDHGTVGSVRIMNMNLFFDGCSDEMMNGGGWDYSSDDQRNLWNKNTDALLPQVTHWSQNTSSSDDWKI